MLADTLRLLSDLHARAVAGRGSVVVLCGDSGLGKTYTVETFVNSLGPTEILFRAMGRPQTSKPLYAVYEALAERLGKSGWQRYSQTAREIAVMLPYVGSWLKPFLPETPRSAPSLPADLFTDRSQYPHIFDFIRGTAKKQPAIFWIDSVQWVDQETLEFLKYLRDRAADGNILWVLCLNPSGPGISSPDAIAQFLSYFRGAAYRDDVCVCELRPYHRDDFDALVARILSGPVELDPGSAALLYERTKGVPYIVRTILKLLLEEGKLVDERGHFRLFTPLTDLSLPESLRSAIADRLRSVYLSVPRSRGLLEAASVIGEQFDDTTLDSVLDLCDTYTLLATIEAQQHLVRNLIEQRRWEFEHVTIRDFVYSSLGRAAGRIHRRLAEHLVASGFDDTSQIAYHFRAAGDVHTAIVYSLLHARQCLHHGFFREAQRTFDELWESGELFAHPEYEADQFGIHYDRALGYFYAGEYEQSLDQLARLDNPPGTQEAVLLGLLQAQCLNKSNRPADFARAAAILEGLTQVPAQRSLAGRILAELVVSYAHLNRYAEAQRTFEQADRLLGASDQVLERAKLMRKSCIFYEPELAIPILKRAAEVARSRRINHETVRALNNLATVYIAGGDYEAAAHTLDAALPLSTELGGFGGDYLLNNLAILRVRSGHPQDAISLLRKALDLTRRPVVQLILHANRAACELAAGSTAVALESLTRLLDQAQVVGEEMYTMAIRMNLAALHVTRGEHRAAFNQLVACDPVLAEFDSAYGEQHKYVLLRLLKATGALRDDRPLPEHGPLGAHPDVYLVD
ncbi:MAG TPA: AAA family ATPase, partial [Longimicrobium sp.]|nr:AAA family ATPase [Longimicrobium sp.]